LASFVDLFVYIPYSEEGEKEDEERKKKKYEVLCTIRLGYVRKTFGAAKAMHCEYLPWDLHK